MIGWWRKKEASGEHEVSAALPVVQAIGEVVPSEIQENEIQLALGAADGEDELAVEARCQLARKIARLLPGLASAKQEDLGDYVLKALEMLARDQVNRVRQLLAEEISDMPNAPASVINALAWDASPGVAIPILQFSPLLTDDILIDIVMSSAIPGVLEAVAKRETVSPSVSDAIIGTGSESAIATLLENMGARLSEETLDYIVEHAAEVEIWHARLIGRPELTQRTVNRIAEFVSSALLEQMEAALPENLKKNLSLAVKGRLQSLEVERTRKAELQVAQLHAHGLLDSERLSDALIAGERAFVLEALHLMSGLPRETVKRIVNARHPGAMTSLAWKAGVSMRTAIQLQMKLAQIHHAQVLHAKGGTDYPLDKAKMKEYLDFFAK